MLSGPGKEGSGTPSKHSVLQCYVLLGTVISRKVVVEATARVGEGDNTNNTPLPLLRLTRYRGVVGWLLASAKWLLQRKRLFCFARNIFSK